MAHADATVQNRTTAGGEVRLRSLVKTFGDVIAVDGINLEVEAGNFFSLLGPSGCGKTTTLRVIAGLEDPTSGQVILDGQDLTPVPSYKRPINTVFQNYALFPHLSVFENVAFGLRRQHVKKGELGVRTRQALDMVRMGHLLKRKPGQLSGGQQQRVALARALVLRPAVLLLDEPLGALDAKLRKALQVELKALQEEVGITLIYVTHDQQEALTMSDWIAVMNGGRVEQVAPPKVMYEEPSTTFVADFLGAANLMEVVASGATDGGCAVRLADCALTAGRGHPTRGAAKVVIRPERVVVESHDASGANRIPGMIERVIYLGHAQQVIIRLPTGERIEALVPVQNMVGEFPYVQGDPVRVHLPGNDLRVLPDTSRSNRDLDSDDGQLEPMIGGQAALGPDST
jgi:spermidine/putrescine transport system ATP-binding protein